MGAGVHGGRGATPVRLRSCAPLRLCASADGGRLHSSAPFYQIKKIFSSLGERFRRFSPKQCKKMLQNFTKFVTLLNNRQTQIEKQEKQHGTFRFCQQRRK